MRFRLSLLRLPKRSFSNHTLGTSGSECSECRVRRGPKPLGRGNGSEKKSPTQEWVFTKLTVEQLPQCLEIAVDAMKQRQLSAATSIVSETHASHLLQRSLDTGTTTVCSEAATGKVAGFHYCHDLNVPTERWFQLMASKTAFARKFELMEEIRAAAHRSFLSDTLCANGLVWYCRLLAVRRDHKDTESAVAKALVSESQVLAKTLGFKQALADCTGVDSMECFESCGFQSVSEYPSISFEFPPGSGLYPMQHFMKPGFDVINVMTKDISQ